MARPTKRIQLSESELGSLTTILPGGTCAAQTNTRARVLDLLHRETHPDDIACLLRVGVATVFNVKKPLFRGRSGTRALRLAADRKAAAHLACAQSLD